MTLPLRLASIVFHIALLVALLSGWYLIWFPSVGQFAIISRTFFSSLLVITVTVLYIVVCDALAGIWRNLHRTPNDPMDE